MNRYLSLAAFLAGLAAVAWVGIGYVGSNPLAMTMTALIGVFYVMGALELHRFHQATRSLGMALSAIPGNLPGLGDWLGKLHPSLQNPVRLRIEGERIGLPGPALTPYLIGLLVLLGMLGTFLGMVVTLNGAVMALESTTDLQAVRASLAAPVKGLGLAFGTSVAGVSASAMLGLVSALFRRERLHTAQLLDTRIANEFRGFSLVHQRQETFKTLQLQAWAMPELVDKLEAMMLQMERQSQSLSEQLLAGQERFHRHAEVAYSELASSVGRSLQESLTESARVAGATIRPAVEATMIGIARETSLLHERMADTVKQQLDGVSERFGTTVTSVSDTWREALAQHQRSSESLSGGAQQALAAFVQGVEQQSVSLLAGVGKAHRELQADLASRDQQRLAAWTQSLEAMAVSLQREWQQAGAQTLGQQEQICRTLEQTARDITAQAQAHARNTITEIGQLMQAASQAPRAAAEVIGQLRHTLSDNLVRDNELLEERSRIMATVSALLDALHHASAEQRGAIDALVTSSAAVLEGVGARFTEKIEAESGKMAAVAAQITGSAVEVSSLGEAFGFGVQLFSESNDKLMAHLQRIEGSLSHSMVRSDEQLAYYVAQAREIIDLSIMSQKQIVEDLQQLAIRQAPLVGEAC